MITRLCVGGPWHGQYASVRGEFVYAPAKLEPMCRPLDSVPTKDDVKDTLYVVREFRNVERGLNLAVLVDESLSTEETIELLASLGVG